MLLSATLLFRNPIWVLTVISAAAAKTLSLSYFAFQGPLRLYATSSNDCECLQDYAEPYRVVTCNLVRTLDGCLEYSIRDTGRKMLENTPRAEKLLYSLFESYFKYWTLKVSKSAWRLF